MTQVMDTATPTLTAWRPTTFDETARYCRAMAASTLVPTLFRGSPANVMWAMSYADMLGMHVLAVMDQVWRTPDGRPAANASLIASLVRRAGHRLTVRIDESALTATAEITRIDDPEPITVVWDLAKALQAELIQGVDEHGHAIARYADGRATPWQLYTTALLAARATTAAARLACPEALFGLCYTPEELGADVDADGRALEHRPRTSAPIPSQVERWRKVIDSAKTEASLNAAAQAISKALAEGRLTQDERTDLIGHWTQRRAQLGLPPLRPQTPADPPTQTPTPATHEAAPQDAPQDPPPAPEDEDEYWPPVSGSFGGADEDRGGWGSEGTMTHDWDQDGPDSAWGTADHDEYAYNDAA